MEHPGTASTTAPAELAHHFVVLHYHDGNWEAVRFSGPPTATRELAAWVCRLCASQGVAASTYPGRAEQWPSALGMDIAVDLADDEEPF